MTDHRFNYARPGIASLLLQTGTHQTQTQPQRGPAQLDEFSWAANLIYPVRHHFLTGQFGKAVSNKVLEHDGAEWSQMETHVMKIMISLV